MKEILISGYYGFKNNGDDALLSCIIEDICRVYNEREKIVVLSANPGETSRIYNIRAIDRMNIVSVIAHMGRAELLISGGGTLIQDGTSTKSLLYYLGIISLAHFFGLKTMLYANGIGPLIRQKNRKRTKKVLDKVDMITLRDNRSGNVLEEIGISKNVHVTADPVFGIRDVNSERGRKILLSLGVPENSRCVGISLRANRFINDEKLRSISASVDECAEKYGLFPVIIPMQKNKDEGVCRKLSGLLKTKNIILSSDMDVKETVSVVSNMMFCIGMRLHTLIYSAVASIPVIGLVYDPKVSGFMEYSNQSLYINIDEISKKRVTDLVDSLMMDYDSIKKQITDTADKMKRLSENNTNYLKQLLERNSKGEK